MRVVLSGGAGFLGSHLCEALLDRGDHVVCLDDLSTASLDNIAHLLDRPTLRVVRTDVSGQVNVAGPVDMVAHLASPASPPDYHRRPLETPAVGSRGTENTITRWTRPACTTSLSGARRPAPPSNWTGYRKSDSMPRPLTAAISMLSRGSGRGWKQGRLPVEATSTEPKEG
jgi:hypothetical protein